MKIAPFCVLLICLLTTSCNGNGQQPETSDQDPESTAAASSQPLEDTECIVQPPEDAESRACIMRYAPVCGCDGKTYSNSCFAALAGVPRTTEGACEDDNT